MTEKYIPCGVIRDLLPLYAENMTSPESAELIEEHISRCGECRSLLAEMRSPQPQMRYSTEPAGSFKKYIRRNKLKQGIIVSLVSIIGVIAVKLLIGGGFVMVMGLIAKNAKVEQDTDSSHYSRYFGDTAEEKYRSKWCMDETIFPAAIKDGMNVTDFKMVYYDPFDAQYLSYLTVEYDSADYENELRRLSDCGISDYVGNYSVTGFSDTELLAMFDDDCYGFVYAIKTPGRENSVTYAEMIFCNYCLDINAADYIPREYLPDGFDASYDNPYQLRKDKEEGVGKLF